MQGFHGGDVLAMRATAGQMRAGAELLAATDVRTATRLTGLEWNGPDAMRARMQWDTTHGPMLFRISRALVEAAQSLEAQAREQEAASSGAPAPAPPVPPPPSVAAAAWDATKEAAEHADALGKVVDGGLISAAASRWDNVNDSLRSANLAVDAMESATFGPLVGGAMQGLGVAGTVIDGAKAYEAAVDGDYPGAVKDGVAAGIGVVGLAGAPAAGGAAGIAWAGGWAIGEGVNHLKEGTAYDAHFTRRMDAYFEQYGAFGMLGVVDALGGAAVDTVVDEATELYRDVVDGADD